MPVRAFRIGLDREVMQRRCTLPKLISLRSALPYGVVCVYYLVVQGHLPSVPYATLTAEGTIAVLPQKEYRASPRQSVCLNSCSFSHSGRCCCRLLPQEDHVVSAHPQHLNIPSFPFPTLETDSSPRLTGPTEGPAFAASAPETDCHENGSAETSS